MTTTMAKQRVCIVGIMFLLLFISGCVQEEERQLPTKHLEKVTIAEFAELFLYAPLYVAKEKGFFAEEGLDVTINPAGGLDKTWAAVISDGAQFGVADPLITAISGEKGEPGVVVASVVSGVPMWGITNIQDLNIRSPSELKNYRVGTTPAPSTAFTLQTQMFKDGGLEPNIRELAAGTCLAALEKGDVDICLEFEPGTSIALSNDAHIAYALSDYYPDFAFTGLFALPEYVNAHPETTQKVVNALQKSLTYIRANPDETAQILFRRFPNVKTEAIAQDALQRLLDTNIFAEDAIVGKEGWDTAVAIRTELGHLKNPALYETYVMATFPENAKITR